MDFRQAIVVTLGLGLSLAAFAQVPAKKQHRTPPTTKTVSPPLAQDALPQSPYESPPIFAPVFFAPGLAVSAYAANEPPKVYAWVESQIASVSGKPDQFTTAEERRAYEAALAEKMKGIAPIPMFGLCQKKYDADRQVFEVKALLSSIKDIALKAPNPEALSLRKLTLSQENLVRDTYMGQNAYGASTEISRSASDDFVIAFPPGPLNEPASVVVSGNSGPTARLPYRYIFNYLSLTVKMPPSEARENEKLLGCLYVFSLEAPYIFRYKERDTPTRDFPFERTSNGFALFGRLDQIAVVHRQTGVAYDQAARRREEPR